MKKVLAVLLSLLTVLSVSTLAASATYYGAAANYFGNGGYFSDGKRNKAKFYSYEGASPYLTISVDQEIPVRTGYNFIGWHFAKDVDSSTLNKIVNGTSYNYSVTHYRGSSCMINLDNESEHTFIACWEKKTYNITYHFNTGAASVTKVKEYDVSYTIMETAPECEGRNFLGWDTSPEATTVVYHPGDIYKKNDNLNLYAVWNIYRYTINFEASDGKNVPHPIEKLHGDGQLVPETIPVRRDYRFDGWSEKKDYLLSDDKLFPGDLLPDKNATLYARWLPDIVEDGITVSGDTSAEGGNEVFEDVYLFVGNDYQYISLQIVYPKCLRYLRFTQDPEISESLYCSQHNSSTGQYLELTAYNPSGMEYEGLIRLGRITFMTDDQDIVDFGTYQIVPDSQNSFYMDIASQKQTFGECRPFLFEYLPYHAKTMTVSGKRRITEPSKYTAVIKPANTTDRSVEWWTDNNAVAEIDQNGLLTPKKNGTVTVYARTLDGSDITASLTVNVAEQKTLIQSFSVKNRPAADMTEDTYSYVIYVPEDSDTAVITVNYSSGTLICEGYGYLFSGVEKTLQLPEDVVQIKMLKSEEDFDSVEYTFIFIKDNNPGAIGEITKRGDADCDGEVSIFDATAIQRYLVSLPMQSFNEIAADVDGDNIVTIFDATAIQRYLVGLPTQEQGIGESIKF